MNAPPAALLQGLPLQRLNEALERLTGAAPDPPVAGPAASAPDIVRLLLARPWRRTAVDGATLLDIETKVAAAVRADRPIELCVPFGGYKSRRQPSFPHVDWAEVFWVDYLRRYAERICAVHPPGVEISFSYMSGVLEWINRLGPDAQSTYVGELRRLLARRASARLRLRLVDHAPAYGDPASLLSTLEQRMQGVPAPTDAERRSARRNLVAQRGQPDAGPIPDEDVELAARRCAAMMSLEARRAFNKLGPRIQISHVRGGSLSLHLGSCRSACAQPWVARGFLEWRACEQGWLERLATGPADGPEPIQIGVAHPLHDVSPRLAVVPLLTTGLSAGPSPA